MKNFKKISIGLTLFLLISVAFFSFSSKAKADFTPTFWDSASFALQDENTIHASTGGQRVTFDNPGGNTYPKGTYRVRGEASGTVPSGFCQPGNTITIKNPANLNVENIPATIKVVYKIITSDSSGNPQTGCREYSNNNLSISNPKANGRCSYLTCSKDDIKALAESTFKFTSYDTITTTFKNKTIKFIDGDATDSDHTFQAPAGLFCSGSGRDNFGAIAISDSSYNQVNKTNSSVKGSLDVDWYDSGSKKCNDFGTSQNNNVSTVNIDATLLANLEGTICTPPGAKHKNLICGGIDRSKCNSQGCVWAAATEAQPDNTAQEEDACEGQNSGFEWILCGALTLMDTMISKTINLIEGLLTFPTNEYLGGDSQVRVAWSIIKNLASVLLVIFMLIMIFSQAISVGPFDAYTVRKLLPKLVIAVIIMQISWTMLIYFIQLANATGQAVQDLMYAPFGGSNEMQFDALVGQLGDAAPAATQVSLFAGAAAVILFSGITIGGAFLLALTAIISVVIGLLVLVLRQMFIILAVILVPIALVLWILPGTQRYWKLWSDNFIRLLMLFPLIMAMIAAGRIFAHVGGNLPNNVATDTALGLIPLLIIFVGVFGPLWFLPKAFSWGGQLFGMASSAAWNGSKRMRNYPGKYALEKAKENRQFNAAERAGRLAENRSRFRRFDELLAGRYNIARNQGARVRQFEATRAQGRKAAEEAVAQEIIGSNFERQSHQDKLQDLFALAQGQRAPNSGISGSSPVAQRFALDKLAEYGDWDAVTNLRSRGLVDRPIWEAFVAKNISAIHQKAPHLSPLRPDLTELSAEDIPNWHSDTMRELEEQATHGVVRNAATGMVQRSADPAAQRRRAVEQAQRALDNPNIAGRMTREQLDIAQRIVNLAGSELLAADDPRLAAGARQNYGRQIGSGTLSPRDQTTFEANVMNIKSQAATSAQAKEIYNQVVAALDSELANRVRRAEQQAVAQGLTPAQVATARSNEEAAVLAERQRLTGMGMTPLP